MNDGHTIVLILDAIATVLLVLAGIGFAFLIFQKYKKK